MGRLLKNSKQLRNNKDPNSFIYKLFVKVDILICIVLFIYNKLCLYIFNIQLNIQIMNHYMIE